MDSATSFQYDVAFSRNIGLLTKEEQQKIKNATVAIAGLGGVGGVHAQALARLGVGHFHISDLDNFEVGNMNRQLASTMETVGKSKVEGVIRMIRGVNPEAEIKSFPQGISEESIDAFLDGADIALDGIDFFTLGPRRLLYRKAREKGIPVICSGPIGFGSSLLVFDPKGMTADDYFDFHDSAPETDNYMKFGLGITPSLMQTSYFRPEAVNWKTKKAPSLIPGVMQVGSLISTEVVKIILGKKIRYVPKSIHFDPYLHKLKLVWMPGGNRNPIQRIKLAVIKMVMKSRGAL